MTNNRGIEKGSFTFKNMEQHANSSRNKITSSHMTSIN